MLHCSASICLCALMGKTNMVRQLEFVVANKIIITCRYNNTYHNIHSIITHVCRCDVDICADLLDYHAFLCLAHNESNSRCITVYVLGSVAQD